MPPYILHYATIDAEGLINEQPRLSFPQLMLVPMRISKAKVHIHIRQGSILIGEQIEQALFPMAMGGGSTQKDIADGQNDSSTIVILQ